MFIKNNAFQLKSKYQPAGDQPVAINNLSQGVINGVQNQVLLGVTGSGKTFTMANIIAKTKRPTLIMAHNKTLAAQLYSEFKEFFPNNAVEYFVSFFDYYQPEAYVPSSDTYIDKDSQINAKIEQMKLSAIYSLLERRDCIVVASVSSIYGIGEKNYYQQVKLGLRKNQVITTKELAIKLAELQYVRNDLSFERSTFRIKGDIVEIFPAHLDDIAVRLSFFGDEIEQISIIDPLTFKTLQVVEEFSIYSASLFATPKEVINSAIPFIKQEMYNRVNYFKENNKLIEAQRIEERTNFDTEMLAATGYTKGIENYVRYLSGRPSGSTPSTLFDYLPKDALIFVDESHASIGQIRGMYEADKSRKQVLVDYGFRLPSCLDNRPLKFAEWDSLRPSTIFVSATPAEFELKLTNGKVQEQLIRPTGLLDPVCEVKPTTNQIEDVMLEIKKLKDKNERVLVISLTKKMAEQIVDYFTENSIKAKYLHSDVDTLERVQIISALRKGEFDVLVGINLLREGIDIPECSLVAILDADKEGFLRSKTSLVQIIGRAARNANGKVLLYANKITDSLAYALDENKRRREIQHAYNVKHNITPTTTYSKIMEVSIDQPSFSRGGGKNKEKIFDAQLTYKSVSELEKIKTKIKKQMDQASEDLNFELAIELREQLKKVENAILLN